jgi:NitT/TauT family transport system substrate-binding protein
MTGKFKVQRGVVMNMTQSRRRFLATLSSVGVAGLFGTGPSFAQEAPPETTTVRLGRIPGVCIAPQYVAEELLKGEGFADVQYVDVGLDIYSAFVAGKVDFSIAFVAPFITQIDMNVPIVLLGGVHVGCYELFGRERVQAIRDLKDKTVAIPALNSPHHMFLASMLAHVGLNANKDIRFVTHPVSESAQVLAEGKVDALIGFPPVPQELRDKKIGHVVVNSGLDRPWSQYFCCVIGGTQEFVSKNPVATKRVLRAILKATHLCSTEPERAARIVADRGYRYDYSLQTMKEIRYALWREYDPEDAVRYYALRLREAGMIKSGPNRIIAQGTDWRFFNELRRELKA